MQILHTNDTSNNATLESHRLLPSIHYIEMEVSGHPRVVQSPVGPGIRCTADDHVVFRYPLSDPMPCPFDFTGCVEGLTLSLWFRGEQTTSTKYKSYIRIASVFNMYRAGLPNRLDFRWHTHKKYRWWNSVTFPENEWVHVALICNSTHTVSYVNGGKRREWPRMSSSKPVAIGHEIKLDDPKAGDYSVGRLDIWSGRASPVFIWRLYQESLPAFT